MAPDLEREKLLAAQAAVGRVEAGMRVALGSGSTAAYAIRLLADRFPTSEVTTVASSLVSERLAKEAGLPVGPLQPKDRFHVMLDGADEIAPSLALTKGGGGALFREKLLARLSREVVIMADHTKLVERLGSHSAIPIEVVPYARPVLIELLAEQRVNAVLRGTANGGPPFITDNGNEILDLRMPGTVEDPRELDERLRGLVGVVETGLFIQLASRVYVGLPDLTVQEILPGARPKPGPAVPAGARA